jgi:DNA-binding transcriptional LysR family regulator
MCRARRRSRGRCSGRRPARGSGQHRTLSFRYLWAGDDWTFEDAHGEAISVRVQPEVYATNGDVLRELAVAGEGIILQPTFIVGADLASGALVPLLTEWKTFELGFYAVYLSRQNLSRKVRVFIDYLSESIGPRPYWERRTTGSLDRASTDRARTRRRRADR